MIYAIIIIATVVSLFLIFRDDHNSDYNKNEKDYKKSEIRKPIKEAQHTWTPPVQEVIEDEDAEEVEE